MNAIIEFTYIYNFVYYVVVLKTNSVRDYLYLFFLLLPKIYIGLARGTNFEMFQIAFMFVYCFFKRQKNVRMGTYLKVGGLVLVAVFLFMQVLSMRGMTSFS